MSNENIWTGFNAYWNGIGAGTGETIEQIIKNNGGRAFGSPAANIAAFQSFEANVVQAIIDSDRNPAPETVTQIENQGIQILSQIIGEAIGAAIGMAAPVFLDTKMR